jgi:hypothetical protein
MNALHLVEILLATIVVVGFGAAFHVAQQALERWEQHRHAED